MNDIHAGRTVRKSELAAKQHSSTVCAGGAGMMENVDSTVLFLKYFIGADCKFQRGGELACQASTSPIPAPCQPSTLHSCSVCAIHIGDKIYHLECQSNPDGSMILRMVKYDFYIALKNAIPNKMWDYIYQMVYC